MLQELEKLKFKNKGQSGADLFQVGLKGMFNKQPQVTNMSAFKSTAKNAPSANFTRMTD